MRRIEENIQVKLVKWFRYQYPGLSCLLTLGSFGENIGPQRMHRLKQMGLTPGYPDLVLFYPKYIEGQYYGGLFIEMKTQFGKVSEAQALIHSVLKQNYIVAVAYSFDEAMKIIKSYIEK